MWGRYKLAIKWTTYVWFQNRLPPDVWSSNPISKTFTGTSVQVNNLDFFLKEKCQMALL